MKILHARFFLLNQYFYGINFAANLLILSLIFDKFFLVLSALKRNRSILCAVFLISFYHGTRSPLPGTKLIVPVLTHLLSAHFFEKINPGSTGAS